MSSVVPMPKTPASHPLGVRGTEPPVHHVLPAERPEALHKPPDQDLQPIRFPTLERYAAGFKNTLRYCLYGGGLAGATLSVLSIFVFNFTSFGVLLGIPTLMSIYIGYSLGKTSQTQQLQAIARPLEELKNINNNPENLDENKVQVLHAIESAKKVKPKHPHYEDIQKELSSLKHLILVRNRHFVEDDSERASGLKTIYKEYLRALADVQTTPLVPL